MDVRCLCLFLLSLSMKYVVGRMKLHNHGYENVVVTIGNHVKEDFLLLKKLQQYLTVTSKALFRATKNQIYFRDFVVVIPQNWTAERHYEPAKDSDITHAQFVIDSANPAYGEAPYVKQYAECGQPGLYIHLTPIYLVNEEITFRWGLPEKTLVHEWAHLRWGLFDEYPIDPQDTPFYRHAGQWQPVRCSTEVEGVLRSEETKGYCPFDMYTGEPGKGCKFYPRMKNNMGTSSIMFMQYLDSITDFCDDPYSAPAHQRHNIFAPNRQNRLCTYRSAWEVMRKHEDFKNIGAPLPAFTDTTPRFRFVQVKPKRRVLVLDASGSMTGSSMKILRQAASNYILTSVESGSWLGIVQFNTEANLLSPMVEIKADKDRYTLLNRLPSYAEGKTSIGSGLRKGLKALEDSKSGIGGTMILITDGKENKSPWIKDIKPRLMRNKVTIHALAYTQQAEPSIAQLAGETEGRTFFFAGQSNSTSLIDSLAATIDPYDTDVFPVSISTESGKALAGTPFTGSFVIDNTIGHDTSLTVTHSADVDIIVRGPSLKLTRKENPQSFRTNRTEGFTVIHIPGIAEVGKWTYTIASPQDEVEVLIHVQSKARSRDQNIIKVKSWLSKKSVVFNGKEKLNIFADVSQGFAPVLEVSVMATMEQPGSGLIKTELLDDGVGADLVKDDGIYSSYILATDLKGNGRYCLKVKVVGEDSARVVTKGHRTGSLEKGTAGTEKMSSTETEPTGEFQRVTSAGEFRVEGYPSMPPQETDVIPPANIVDLRVLSFDPDSGIVTLDWTAVGDDMARGTATGYAVQISPNITHILKHLSQALDASDLVVNGTLLSPKPAGSRESLRLELGHLQENHTVFLVIRAYDEVRNYGSMSNIVSVSHVTEVAVERHRTVRSSSFIFVVVAPLVAFLLFIVLMTVMCIVWSSRRDSSDLKKQDENSIKTIAIEFPYMNYRVDGEYVQRWREEHASWQ